MAPKRVARPVDPSIYAATDPYGTPPPAREPDFQQHFYDPSQPQLHQQQQERQQGGFQQQDPYQQQNAQQQKQQQQPYQQPYPAQAYPTNPIAQPPHSTGHSSGRAGGGSRQQLDPALVPSPIASLAHAQAYTDSQFGGVWGSSNEQGPPASLVEFKGVDEGASTPTYVRSSLAALPTTADLLKTAQLPLGIHVTPFAPPLYGEAPIPVVSTGEEGPERCKNCKGYLSSLCIWEGGGRWKCNLCGTANSSTSSIQDSALSAILT